jgi:hypothetical protein
MTNACTRSLLRINDWNNLVVNAAEGGEKALHELESILQVFGAHDLAAGMH